ncbi:MAG: LCP family protein, partial [Clostridiales bacterium]
MTDSEQDIRPVTNYQKPKKNRGRVFRRLSAEKKFCVAMLCIFVLAWAFYLGLSLAAAMMPPWEGYYITGNKDLSLPTIEDDDMKVILAVGCDKRPNDVGRTDTILLAFVDPKQGDVKVLSIPRDTYVTIPGSGKKTKINHAYAYGGIPLTEETIESAFGIKVDNFMEINFQGFTQVIDALG